MTIPNAVTSLRILLGLQSILLLSQYQSGLAFICILVSIVLDGFDGWLARALNQESRLGEYLDSIADFIAFGIAPAFGMMLAYNGNYTAFATALGLLYILSAAIRLIRYHFKACHFHEGGRIYYKGLPTPLSALILIACLYFLLNFVYFQITLVLTILVLSLLMNSRIIVPGIKRMHDSNHDADA
ncbi:MAG: CDP-diacylglycerol--serine O-phosphatidyltransferase [Candidatus Omnitrophota bacterium]|jgi:CDP-diacylglycerol--serine O-phosphatidyltransferase